MTTEPTVIVKPDERPVEQWYCLATDHAATKGWAVLATKAGEYKELSPFPISKSDSRHEALDKARRLILTDPSMARRFTGHLLIPINYMVGVDNAPIPNKSGSRYVPMWPKRMPTCGNATEALDRIRITLARDMVFKRKFNHWRFVPVRFDDAVEVP